MTYSLKLENGDLVAEGSGLATVDNASKIVQDLRLELLQKMGEDRIHPDYGSLMDGGMTSDGTIYESIIGETDDSLVELRIKSEISRIVRNYQSRQLARARADKFNYNKQTLTKGEILLGTESVEITRYLDQMKITVFLTTGEGQNETIDIMLDI